MLTRRALGFAPRFGVAAVVSALLTCYVAAQEGPPEEPALQGYEYRETRDLVVLVDDAAKLVEADGEEAFAELRAPDSRWRHGETYVLVLDLDGTTLVHPDPAMEGKRQMALKDVDGRLIIKGLIDAATALPDKQAGWYHYQWPVPGELLPRWKSTYVRHAVGPSGKHFVVGSGVYNDRMEKAFVVDMVRDAVGRVEKLGKEAFPLFHDRTGPFLVKDAYIFVIDPSGVDLVNPAFPNLEGRNIHDLKDTQGKLLIREMLETVEVRGSGWVDYMWPKPGDNVSTQKSAYVSKADVGGKWLLVGSGVYLAGAPTAPLAAARMEAPELVSLVREGAALFEKQGEKAFAEFRTKGSKWLHDDLYFFVWTPDGTRRFHAVDPSLEGKNAREAKDVNGRPYGRMLLEAAAGPSGEGWVHYMYPEPGDIFPAWKSVLVKRVVSPSGTEHLIGAGIYQMRMNRAFIEDVVERASALVATEGPAAFDKLRDRTGPFLFMDTYVFVNSLDGVELVNPAQPSLEGRNLIDVKDVNGKHVVKEYIAAVTKDGAAWVDYHWYKPGQNTPARKQAYVRLVKAADKSYIVGSGVYLEE